MDFVDEKFHQLVSSDGSKANATIITTSVDGIGDGNFNLSSLDDGERETELKQRHLKSKNNNIKNDNTKNDVEEANNSLEKQTVIVKLITQFLKTIDWKLAMLVSLCGISFGAMTLLAYIGVKLIPLSDFVVFGHTAPVFTLVLSAIILR